MKKIIIVLMVIISLFAISCSEKEFVSDNESSNVQKQEQQEDAESSKSEIIGMVIEENEIINEDGGFIIPIPDSWFGKASYENIGKETLIYHITNDQAELSQNPVLLHVGALYDGDEAEAAISADIFLELDGVSFYDVPVLDFPYELESQDGKEYKSFLDDKMLMLQSFWTLDESSWNGALDYTTLLTQSNWIATTLYKGSDRQDAEYWWVSFNRDKTFDSNHGDFAEVSTWSLEGDTLNINHEFDVEIYTIDIIEQDGGYILTLFDYAGEGSVLELESTDFEDNISYDEIEDVSISGEFTSYDATLNGIMLASSMQSVLDNISIGYNLESQEQVEYGATGDIIDVYHYSFGSLSFNGNFFTEAVVNEPGIMGPRGFEVGDNISDIIDSFAGFDALKIEDTTVFYRYNGDDIDSHNHVPPYFIMDEESGFLTLSCFEDESILSELSYEEIKENYYFEITNNCNFYFDENNIVTSFSLYHGAMSE